MKLQLKKPERNTWWTLLACVLLPVYLELVLHLFVYKSLSSRIVYPLLFSMAGGFLFFAVCTAFSRKINRILAMVLTVLMVLYFEIQFTYNSIFGEFMSLWQVTFGATAIANFGHQMLYGIWKALLPILVLMLPIGGMAMLIFKNVLRFERVQPLHSICALVLLFAVHFAAVGVMQLSNTNAYSVYRLYTNSNTATEISVKNIGLLSTSRLEAKFILLGGTVSEEEAVVYPTQTEKLTIKNAELEKYNMLELDFDALADATDDATLKKLDQYFDGETPTEKNDYTGQLADYNLIFLCAESFSSYLIDPERTPALYQLATNGYIFENYYGSFASNTTNGEYTYCMGLFPDLSRSKSTASFYASQQNYLPFCLGNEFFGEGAQTWAYHNYTGEYYSRNVTHPNMGFTFQSATDGLDIPLTWPSSDLDMMVASVDDYIDSGEQFCAYYMSFSGHFQYDWDNPMSEKNRAVVQDLPYSDTVKAYISCNMELEYAMEYLLNRLEQAGIADKTAIVLTNDHYPYGLTESEYNELAGKTVDTTFEKYRNSFLCYVPGVQETVDTYCCTVDILPTLLNLFGFDYDSRLLVGKDILSPSARNAAVLSDQSFITKDFAFDTSTGTLTCFTGTEADHQAEIESLQSQIALDFQISTDVLGSDYYAHAVLGREESGQSLQDYPFTDIPDDLSLAALDYVYNGGYMEPISETKFGFDTPCTYAELLDVLYRISGSPEIPAASSASLGSSNAITGKYAPAVQWAMNNNLLPELEHLDSFTTLSRKNAAVTLYRYARLQGEDCTLSDDVVTQWQASYPSLSTEQLQSLAWCYAHAVMRSGGTLASVLDQADQEMSRFYVVSTVYNYYLYFVQ